MILNHIALVILSLVVGHASGQIILIASDRFSNRIKTANLWLVLNNANVVIFLQVFRKFWPWKGLKRSQFQSERDPTTELLQSNRNFTSGGLKVTVTENGMIASSSSLGSTSSNLKNDNRDIDLKNFGPASGSRATAENKWKTHPKPMGTFKSIFTILLYIVGLGISRFLSVPILYGTNPVFILPNPESDEYGDKNYVNETGDSLINVQFTNRMYPWAHFYDKFPLHPNGLPNKIDGSLSTSEIMMGLYATEMAKLLEIEEELNTQEISLYNLSLTESLAEASFYHSNHSFIDTGFSSVFTTYNNSVDTVPVPIISIPNSTYTSRVSSMFLAKYAKNGYPAHRFHNILRQLLINKEYFKLETYDPKKRNYYKMPIYYMYYGTFDFGDLATEYNLSTATPYVGLFNGSIKDNILTTEMIHSFDVNQANDTNLHFEFTDGLINGVPWLDLLHSPKMYTSNDDYSFTYTNSEMKATDFYLFSCDNNGTEETYVYDFTPTEYTETNITVETFINCTDKFYEEEKLVDSNAHKIINPLFIRYTWLHEHKYITLDDEVISDTSGFASKALYLNPININGSQRYYLPKNSKYTNIETRYVIHNGLIALMCFVILVWVIMLAIPTLKRSSTIIFIEEQAIESANPFFQTIFLDSHVNSNENSSNL